jgi:hypothetical protein
MITIPANAIRAAATAIVIGAVSLGTAGLAYAERPMSDNDQAFLNSLSEAGIGFADPAATIALAGAVCDDVAAGSSYDDLFKVTTERTDLSADQADALIFDSVFYYCVDLLPYVV